MRLRKHKNNNLKLATMLSIVLSVMFMNIESIFAIELGTVKGVENSMPSVGNVHTLAILCDFEDNRFDDNILHKVDDAMNGVENKDSFAYPYESLAAFYKRSSFGRLSLSNEQFIYHSPNNKNYYYRESADTDLIQDCIDAYVNFVMDQCDGTQSEKETFLNQTLEKFDSNNDGFIDGIYIITAGEKADGMSSPWWPHASYYNGYCMGEYTVGSICQLGEKDIEDSWPIGNYNATTLIHESGHMLGLVDLYNTKTAYNETTSFDTMEGNAGDLNGYFKLLLGWIDLQQVPIIKEKDIKNYTIRPYATTGDMVIVIPDYVEENGLYTELYLIEYYNSVENDTISKLNNAKGLRVYHINARLNERKDGFKFSNSDESTAPFMTVFDKDATGEKNMHSMHSLSDRSNGSFGYGNYGLGDYDCIYYSGDELTPYSSPASFKYGNNDSAYSALYSGFFVKDIVIDDDKASFQTGFETEKSEPDITYSIYKNNAGSYAESFMLKLLFHTDIRFSNEKDKINAAYIVDENDQVVADLEMRLYTGWKPYNFVTFVLNDTSPISEEKKYTVVIPKGTILSTYGTSNDEIRIDYDKTKKSTIDKKAVVPIDQSSEICLPCIDSEGNGIYFVGQYYRDQEKGCYVSPAEYYLYPVKDYVCGEKINFSFTDLENQEKYDMSSAYIKSLGNDEYGIIWHDFSVGSHCALYRVINKNGELISTRIVDYGEDCKGAEVISDNITIWKYDDYYKIFDFYDEKNDITVQMPQIEDTPTWTTIGEDVCVYQYLLDGDCYRNDIYKNGELVYIDYGRADTKNGTSRFVSVKKIDGCYYYITESYVEFDDGDSIYQIYVDIFDGNFKKIEGYALDGISSCSGKIYKIKDGFIVPTGSGIAVYDNHFNYIRTLRGILLHEFVTSPDSLNIIYADKSGTEVMIKHVSLEEWEQQAYATVSIENSCLENGKFIIHDHSSKDEIEAGLSNDGLYKIHYSQKHYLTDGDYVGVGDETGKYMKYVELSYASDFRHEPGAVQFDETNPEVHQVTCAYCKQTYEESHQWDEGVMIQEATSFEEGQKLLKCNLCFVTRLVSIEKLPSSIPSEMPSEIPSESPSVTPSESPSIVPSENPSEEPSVIPSTNPSGVPDSSDSDQINSLHVTFEIPYVGEEAQSLNNIQIEESDYEVYATLTEYTSEDLDSYNGQVLLTDGFLETFFANTSQSSFEGMAHVKLIDSLTPGYMYTTRFNIVRKDHKPISDDLGTSDINVLLNGKVVTATYSRQGIFETCDSFSVKGESFVAANNPNITPSEGPSIEPSENPFEEPSVVPSEIPSEEPSVMPSETPSEEPSVLPSEEPSSVPSEEPSAIPSEHPSEVPSVVPSISPSVVPSIKPSDTPSTKPEVVVKSQKITVSKKAAKTVVYKAKNLKKKKATFSIGAKAKTKLSYNISSKAKKYISVSKSGKVTLKKGCKKGTYKITITAARTKDYMKATKTVTIKVK